MLFLYVSAFVTITGPRLIRQLLQQPSTACVLNEILQALVYAHSKNSTFHPLVCLPRLDVAFTPNGEWSLVSGKSTDIESARPLIRVALSADTHSSRTETV
jgi:hypothetical protein